MHRSSLFSAQSADVFRIYPNQSHFFSPLPLPSQSFSVNSCRLCVSISNFCSTSYGSTDSGVDNRRPLSFIHQRPLIRFKVYAAASEPDKPKWWEKNGGPNMVDIHSTQDFLGVLSQAGDRLVIVDFYGTWCASCRALFPKLCKIAEEHPEILFLKVNFDENKSLCKSLNVKVLPYFHFYRGADRLLDSFSCSLAKFQKLKDAITTHNTARHSRNSTGDGDISSERSLGIPEISPALNDKPSEPTSR